MRKNSDKRYRAIVAFQKVPKSDWWALAGTEAYPLAFFSTALDPRCCTSSELHECALGSNHMSLVEQMHTDILKTVGVLSHRVGVRHIQFQIEGLRVPQPSRRRHLDTAYRHGNPRVRRCHLPPTARCLVVWW